MCFVMMAAEMRMAINLPVGDLSHFWPRTDLEMGKAEKEALSRCMEQGKTGGGVEMGKGEKEASEA